MVDPDTITHALGLPPSQTVRKGQLDRIMPSGRVVPRSRPAEYGLWKYWLGDELRALPLNEQLMYWAEVLVKHTATLQDYLRQGWTVELNCCVIAKTTVVNIPARLQARFGELGVDLSITFYQTHRPRYKSRQAV